MSINFLKLMHLADSAFPIGAASHSFGIETLVAEGLLTAPHIEHFLTDLLWESGKMEASFCRLAHRGSATPEENVRIQQWLQLNQTIAAAKGARESRVAGATLGRRFLQAVIHLEEAPALQEFYERTRAAAVEIHYCAAFGLVGGHLALDEEETVLAYLQQSIMGMVSACQRLLPIGQGRASEILWRLKPLLAQVAQSSRAGLPPPNGADTPSDLPYAFVNLTTFTPLVDLGSMRHPTLPTRLFIS